MKKSLLSLLIIALVFTMAAPAFAAVPADVKGTNAEEAVAKLSSLGILQGYPDGTFRPDNTITRAEFSKIVAYAGGFGKAAEYLGATNTGFSDVSANHWAAGYVAVAANKGYVKGYEDGTFRPEATITDAEVITVLLRVLGYNDKLVGSWPSDYIIEANELGLLADVAFNASTSSSRAKVAVLTSGTLSQNLVAFDKDLEDFFAVEKSGKTISLISKAFETSFTTAVVNEPNFVGDDKNKVSLLVDGTVKSYTASDLYILGADSLAELWGSEVEVLLDGTKIKFVNSIQSTDDVVAGTVDSVTGAVYEIDGEDYEFATGAVVVLNNKDAVAGDITANAEGTFFLNEDGDIRYAIATNYDVTNKRITALSSVTTTGTAYISYDSTRVKVNADDTVFTVNGEVVAYEDLAKNMIINFVKDGLEATIVDATDATVTGDVQRTSSKGTVNVDGKAYTLVTTADYSSFTVGEEYTLYLNADGKVVDFAQVTGIPADAFTGFLVSEDTYYEVVNGRTTTNTIDEAVFVSNTGEVVTLSADSTDNKFGSVAKKDVAKVEFDTDGNVDTVTREVYGGSTSVSVTVGTISKSINRIELGANTYRFDNNTVVYDVTNFKTTADQVKVLSISDLAKGMEVLFNVDGNVLTHVVVTDNGVANADQLGPVTGIFIDEYSELGSSNTTHNYAVLNVEGVEVTVEVDAALALTEGDQVSLTDVDADGVYETQETVYAESTYSYIDADGKFFDGTTNYYLTDLSVIYVLTTDSNGDLVVDFGTTFDIEEVVSGSTTGSVTFTSLVDADGVEVELGNGFEVGTVVVDLR
jgi:hypothetical protein